MTAGRGWARDVRECDGGDDDPGAGLDGCGSYWCDGSASTAPARRDIIGIMRIRDLTSRLADRPFRGFRIHLSDGSSIPVTDPGMLIVGPSSAVLPTEFGKEEGERVATRWRTVALAHMVQFSDLDEPLSGKRRKRG